MLEGEEARHCAQVTRHRKGDAVVVFDGCGRKAMARIESLSSSAVHLAVLEETQIPAPVPEVTLIQAIVKGDTMDWIIEKAVELGVRRIVPLMAQRSIVRLNAAEAAKKQLKWQRVALEASKQCGQVWLPEVVAPCNVASACALIEKAELKLIASLQQDAASLSEIRKCSAARIAHAALAIGPEGDFTDEEYDFLRQAGGLPWSLGKLTLRSETAAICALSILGYELAPE